MTDVIVPAPMQKRPRSLNPWRGLGGLPRDGWTICLASFVNRAGTMVPGAGMTLRSVEPAFYTLFEDSAPGFAGPFVVTAFLPVGVSDSCWVGTTVEFSVP